MLYRNPVFNANSVDADNISDLDVHSVNNH